MDPHLQNRPSTPAQLVAGWLAPLVLVGLGACVAWRSPTDSSGGGAVAPSEPPMYEAGTVHGRVVYQGEIPRLPPLVRQGATDVKDASLVANGDVPDESLLVDAATAGVANVFVYLARPPQDGGTVEPGASLPPREVRLEAARFQPHVLMARTGQTIVVTGADPVLHNSHPMPLRNTSGFCQVIPPSGQPALHVFPRAEKTPFPVVCDFHAWEKGYWLILDHPHAALTDSRGEFVIRGLPPGRHELVVWHERVGYVERRFLVEVSSTDSTNVGEILFREPPDR